MGLALVLVKVHALYGYHHIDATKGVKLYGKENYFGLEKAGNLEPLKRAWLKRACATFQELAKDGIYLHELTKHTCSQLSAPVNSIYKGKKEDKYWSVAHTIFERQFIYVYPESLLWTEETHPVHHTGMRDTRMPGLTLTSKRIRGKSWETRPRHYFFYCPNDPDRKKIQKFRKSLNTILWMPDNLNELKHHDL